MTYHTSVSQRPSRKVVLILRYGGFWWVWRAWLNCLDLVRLDLLTASGEGSERVMDL